MPDTRLPSRRCDGPGCVVVGFDRDDGWAVDDKDRMRCPKCWARIRKANRYRAEVAERERINRERRYGVA